MHLCTIPFGRGNSRSAPIGQVIEQVERLTDNGIQEVVLTGVDLTSLGQICQANPVWGNWPNACWFRYHSSNASA